MPLVVSRLPTSSVANVMGGQLGVDSCGSTSRDKDSSTQWSYNGEHWYGSRCWWWDPLDVGKLEELTMRRHVDNPDE